MSKSTKVMSVRWVDNKLVSTRTRPIAYIYHSSRYCCWYTCILDETIDDYKHASREDAKEAVEEALGIRDGAS